MEVVSCNHVFYCNIVIINVGFSSCVQTSYIKKLFYYGCLLSVYQVPTYLIQISRSFAFALLSSVDTATFASFSVLFLSGGFPALKDEFYFE